MMLWEPWSFGMVWELCSIVIVWEAWSMVMVCEPWSMGTSGDGDGVGALEVIVYNSTIIQSSEMPTKS